MVFIVAPATPEDAHELAALWQTVWASDEQNLACQMYPMNDPSVTVFWRETRLNKSLRDPNHWQTKVVDSSTNTIVAYGVWQLLQSNPKTSWLAEQKDAPDSYWPKGANLRLIKDFYGKRDAVFEKVADQEFGFILRGLCTHPDYQRRGLASMVLRDGLDKIDAVKGRSYLEATAAGRGLYLKHGWRTVEQFDIDLKDYGVENGWVETTACMIRDPKSGG